MSVLPSWLPEMLCVSPWTGGTFDALYEVFERDFKHSQAGYDGLAVWFFRDMEDGREVIFWHLTSRKDKDSGDRLPDLRRCERLCWGRPMLDHAKEPEILAWDYEEDDGDTNTYVWLKDHDFLVLMKKMKDGTRRLLTSFWVEYDNYRRKLMKKYDRRIG
jgi:hypothetical protein